MNLALLTTLQTEMPAQAGPGTGAAPSGDAPAEPFADVFAQLRAELLAQALGMDPVSGKAAPSGEEEANAESEEGAELSAEGSAGAEAISSGSAQLETVMAESVEKAVTVVSNPTAEEAARAVGASETEAETPLGSGGFRAARLAFERMAPSAAPARSGAGAAIAESQVSTAAGELAHVSVASEGVTAGTLANAAAQAEGAGEVAAPMAEAVPAEAQAAAPQQASKGQVSAAVVQAAEETEVAVPSQSGTGASEDGESTEHLLAWRRIAAGQARQNTAETSADSDLWMRVVRGGAESSLPEPGGQRGVAEGAVLPNASSPGDSAGASQSASLDGGLLGAAGAKEGASAAAVLAKADAAPENAQPTARIETIVTDTVKQVRYLEANGRTTVTVRLIPESLGEMRIEIQSTGNEMTVRLVSASPLVREALEAQAAGLREVLGRNGADVGKVEISNGLASNADPGGQPSHHAAGGREQSPHRFSTLTSNYANASSLADVQNAPERMHDGNLNVFA